MPQEIRRLAFSHSETTDALKEYGKRFNVSMPDGRVLHARFASEGETPQAGEENKKRNRNIIVTFYSKQNFEHKYYNLSEEFVTAALIQYCLANQIMLAKSAKKTLDITEFNVCIDMQMTIGDPGETPEKLSLDE